MLNIIGFIANIISLVLWLPQARLTWKNRNNPEALKGISIGTQVLVAINTSLWCLYGILTHDTWLPLATIVVLPLALWTIILKLKSRK